MDNAKVNYIDGQFKKLTNLEIFAMSNSDEEFFMPFESISQLTKLKAIYIDKVPYFNNTVVPSTVCQLTDIVFFSMILGSNFIKSIPFDCIADSWTNLEYFDLFGYPGLTKIDPKFFLLPKLKTAFFDWTNFNSSYFTFKKFNGFSDTLNTVSLSLNSGICYDNITVNNTVYDGFGYLNSESNGTNTFTYSDDNRPDEKYALLKFIAKFDPCEATCDSGLIVCPKIYCCLFICELLFFPSPQRRCLIVFCFLLVAFLFQFITVL